MFLPKFRLRWCHRAGVAARCRREVGMAETAGVRVTMWRRLGR